jgi:D-alanine-D-alanine ligase
LRIGIAYSLMPSERGQDGPDDRYEEFDKPETVGSIADAIRAEGHEVELLGDGRELLGRLLDDPPDFVFNFAEGQGVGRCREARVPAALEMLGIPYSGSDPLTLAATLDKATAKQLLRGHVEMPRHALIPGDLDDGREIRSRLAGTFGDPFASPVILKPNLEGSSKGIRGRCLAHDAEDAVDIIRRLADDYRQPILAEEFIDGDELTVGVIGNGPEMHILGTMRVVPRRPVPLFVYSLEVKRDWARQVEYEAPARLPVEVLSRLSEAAKAVYTVLGCRDVARVDFRVRGGVSYFLEVNPLPGLAPGTSDLVIMAQGYGIGHGDLVRRILHAALTRVGLARHEMASP